MTDYLKVLTRRSYREVEASSGFRYRIGIGCGVCGLGWRLLPIFNSNTSIHSIDLID